MMTQQKKDDLFMLALAIFACLSASGIAFYFIWWEKQYAVAVPFLVVIFIFAMTPVVFARYDFLEKEAKKRREEERQKKEVL